MKKCPYCAEEIQEEALKCRYCGTELMPILRTDSKSKIVGFFINLFFPWFGNFYLNQIPIFPAVILFLAFAFMGILGGPFIFIAIVLWGGAIIAGFMKNPNKGSRLILKENVK